VRKRGRNGADHSQGIHKGGRHPPTHPNPGSAQGGLEMREKGWNWCPMGHQPHWGGGTNHKGSNGELKARRGAAHPFLASY